MSRNVCCVENCNNSPKNSAYKFFKFPRAIAKIHQRNKWIQAVKKKNADGTPWGPTPWHYICSQHFVDNKKSNDPLSPSYAPTIWPSMNKRQNFDTKAASARHKRFIARNMQKVNLFEKKNNNCNELTSNDEAEGMIHEISEISQTVTYADQECQVYICTDSVYKENKSYELFVCNLYKNDDAAVQTDIYDYDIDVVRLIEEKKTILKHKKVGTDRVFVDAQVGPNISFENSSCFLLNEKKKKRKFEGYASVKKDSQLLGLAGVSINVFNYLLTRLENCEPWNIPLEDRLLMTLVKFKTGLTFSAIAVLFDVHRTTLSKIFTSKLQRLVCATKNNIFWPNKDIVQGTMPECFKPDYMNTRVIIDCTEFRTEIPKTVDNRVFFYSHYKKGFTVKVLIGITPCGFISFKSKVAGGRKSDGQITTESGLLDLLEDGDVVLADKGFPEIRATINENGKNVTVDMPPFLRNNAVFTKEETEQTYNIARVRIHVERIMQRLRIYKILDKIPVTLFNSIDDIVHLCCVLVNLQPSIIKEADEGEVVEDDEGEVDE